MNILLLHRPGPADRQHRLERSAGLLGLADQEPDGRRRRLLRSLIGLLLPPESPLSALPLEEGFALAQAALTLMDGRDGELALLALASDGDRPDWLLVNAADVPYTAASLQNLPCAREGLLSLKAYLSLAVRRGAAGIEAVEPAGAEGGREALMVMEADGCAGAESAIRASLAAALRVAQDRPALATRLDGLAQACPADPERELLDWLREGAFMPFAYGRFESRDGEIRVEEKLGIAALAEADYALASGELASLPPGLTVRQTRTQSPLCRPEPLRLVGCRESLADGSARLHGFLGLLSKEALRAPALAVPALRRKINRALDCLTFPPGSYDYQRTAELFNAFPKLELFATPEETLYLIARSLPRYLAEPGRIKLLLLASPDPETFVLLGLVPNAWPQESGLSGLGDWLARQIPAELCSTQTIKAAPDHTGLCWAFKPVGETVRLDLDRLEKGLDRLSQAWERRFRCFLRRTAGPKRGAALAGRYLPAFPLGYREATLPVLAGRDVLHLEQASASGAVGLELWQSKTAAKAHPVLRLYGGRGRFLDEILPILGALGLRVAGHMPFALELAGVRLGVNSFAVEPARPAALPLLAVKKTLLKTLAAVFDGRVENDGLNALLPLTGLGWQEIDLFRGYRNYYLQLGGRFTRERFHQALLNNPQTALLLYRYFDARFRPGLAAEAEGEEALGDLRMEIAAALDQVADSSEDRILRDLFNLLDATLRTNHYLRRGQADYFLAFKIGSLGLLDLPSPGPQFELYVHSAKMEGIHLRGAKVARGGIRWSDRPDDFRTEILGLQKTQTIKNALIVPHGAKGGFIVKTPYASRAEGFRLAGEAYATLMRGLLDLTDNLGAEGVTHPPGVLAYDGGDPYLVVAADKGTAHLSDTANAIARDYGFWLDDAFASGGSRGYDHKKLGITARGAFECVRRHFHELGLDIDREPFSVVGIGSMDGDVFGNGMLLFPCIRLKAAFGAKHIFLDPEPGESAWQERRRLFDLPGSSWDDYDRSLISPGGGVFLREAKDIPLSPAVRQWLGAHHASVDGEGLIRLLLQAPVDLLWLGGIGTYVKASGETCEQVGDRANDAVRVDANRLRARVVGEGANLGFTQKARIEYALSGGKINNDAVDNSGGVDLSDHEVNLKILMAGLRRKGVLPDDDSRDLWLQAMTDEVCAQVINNNRLQSLCLSLDRERCLQEVEPFLEVADRLEQAGLLDRGGESFPPGKEVLARRDKALTRPELAVLMLHSKLALKQALLKCPGFLAEPKLKPYLAAYFPSSLRERQGGELGGHSLAAEITATCLTNTLINQAGCGLLAWVDDLEPAALAQAAQAYLDFDGLLDGAVLREKIYSLRHKLPADSQYPYLLRLENTLAEQCRWAMGLGLGTWQQQRWREMLRDYLGFLARTQTQAEQAEADQVKAGLEAEGFTPEQAGLLALLDRLGGFPLLAELALKTEVAFPKAAQAYQAMAEALGLARIEALLDRPAARDVWERRVQAQLKERFRLNLARLSRALLEAGAGEPAPFLRQRAGRVALERWHRLRRELSEVSAASILPYAALGTELERLAETCASA